MGEEAMGILLRRERKKNQKEGDGDEEGRREGEGEREREKRELEDHENLPKKGWGVGFEGHGG